MGDASLSQEEIDALLMGADEVGEDVGDSDFQAADNSRGSADFTTLIKSFNDAMKIAAKSASSLVNKNIQIRDLVISDSDRASAGVDIPPNSIIIEINMGSHRTAMVFEEQIARKIAMYMMGATEVPETMDDAYLSTIGELANTILSSLSNNLGQKFKDDLTPSSPTTRVYQGGADLPEFDSNQLKKLEFEISIDKEDEAKLIQYIDEDTILQWSNSIGEDSEPQRSGGSAPQQQYGRDQQQSQQQPSMGQMSGGYQMSAGKKDYSGGQVNVNPVTYPSLAPSGMKGQMPTNIELLLDVQMILTVELGRTKKYVKDILGLGEGSIIELDKLAGEPVDLLVNGKLIAKGEVVVIDENFGVRVTDIVGPAERLARLASE